MLNLTTSRTRTKILLLIRNKQPSNRRTGKCTNSTREHGTDRHPRDVCTATRRDLRKHTDLVTQGADVGEAAEGVGGDEARAVGEVVVGWVCLEGVVGDEFVLLWRC